MQKVNFSISGTDTVENMVQFMRNFIAAAEKLPADNKDAYTYGEGGNVANITGVDNAIPCPAFIGSKDFYLKHFTWPPNKI